MQFDLSGKTALITGGSRGLGREIALAYADAGADVIIVSRKLEACEAVCVFIVVNHITMFFGVGLQLVPTFAVLHTHKHAFWRLQHR